MDPDKEVLFDFPAFKIYKSGRIERLEGTEVVPACVDSATGVASRDVIIDACKKISARLCIPNILKKTKKKIPVLIYIHGGAFCVYSPFSLTYHSFVNSLVSKTDLLVVSVDYRLAPEHLLPTAYEDSWDAVKWVCDLKSDTWLADYGDFNHVFVAGDSAGANITHQMVFRAGYHKDLRGGPKINFEGMLLIDPYFWGKEPVGSETTDAKERKKGDEFWKVISVPGIDIDDPRINPMAKSAPSLKQLACTRAMICVASDDTLADRGRLYFSTLKESGWKGDVELFESEGEGHCFHLKNPDSEDALELMDKMVSFFEHEKKSEGMKCCAGLVHVWNRQILPFLNWKSYVSYHAKMKYFL